MTRWTHAQLERVLWALAPDCTPREWAARSGLPETTVRIATAVVARQRRQALGWTMEQSARAAGLSMWSVLDVERGRIGLGLPSLWAAYDAGAARRETTAARIEGRPPMFGIQTMEAA